MNLFFCNMYTKCITNHQIIVSFCCLHLTFSTYCGTINIKEVKIMNTENLKKARKKSGKTQQQIADLLGLSQSAYRYYEQGLREPSHKTLVMIAKILNVTTDYLLGVDSNPEKIEKRLSIKEMEQDLIHSWLELDYETKEIAVNILKKLAYNKHINEQQQDIHINQTKVEVSAADLLDDDEATYKKDNVG